ncbi:cuticle protein 7-like [Amphibalanus amphitrite]|uniref:cuticle protein 7-like n=1 Tax=Amphibalanus amphitrite TaxID=1232801 RepID=UPI001C911273|nr:cuticle protein 7-like [Amphibalanus amphitrite]
MKVFIVAAVLAVAAAAPAPDTPVYKPAPAPYKPAPAPYKPEPQYKDEPRPYAFDYAVNDKYFGTNFAQNEKSDGHNAQGSYTVALPDGRIQTVKYVADHYKGFNAEVTYQGKARHPDYKPASYKPSPGYKPAPKY